MRISSILDFLLTVCAALWRNKECCRPSEKLYHSQISV